MVVKVYVSGISGNKEVKKRQQRVLMILDSKNIKYDVIDITEPGKESDKDFMQNNSKSNGGTVSDPNPRSPLPPQLFNDEEYCGDYDQFDLSNEVDTLEQFLKMEAPPEEPALADTDKDKAINGDAEGDNVESSKDSDESENKTASDEKEGSPAKDVAESKEENSVASKEGTPSKEDENVAGDSKEKSPQKEIAERQKSVDKEGTPEVKAQSPEKEVEATSTEALEGSPEKEVVNKNGSLSSRENSQAKDTPTDVTEVDRKKDSLSEALIQSEQAAAAE